MYWSIIGDVNSSDFSEGSLQGWDDDGQFTVFHTLANDNTTEGNETLYIKLYSDSSRTNEVSSATVSVIDTSQGASPTYSISTSSSVDEGGTLSTTISKSNVAAGTNLYWSISGSGIDSSDFTVSPYNNLTGFDDDDSFTIYHKLANDLATEGNETLYIKLYSDQARTTQVGSTKSVTINDTSKSSSLTGTDSDDTINGTTDNDNIKGGGGSDVIDGGAGDDTVTYTGKFNDYTFTKTTTSIQITDIRITSPDGVDTVKNIEYIQFSDQLVASDKVNVVKTFSSNFRDYKFYNKGDGNYEIKSSSGTTDDITGIPKLTFADKTTGISAIADIKGVFDQITGKENATGEMFRLYNAAFARFPDSDGLKYWINKYSSGENDSRAVASSFLVSAEFSERYGANVTNAKYVETLYTNVLGRDYDQSGYNYWLGNLNAGTETRYELLLGFAESTENKALFTEMTGFS